MKKKLITLLILLGTVGTSTSTIALADSNTASETSNNLNKNNNLESLDKYVSVSNNQFVLDISNIKDASQELIDNAQQTIDSQNAKIKEFNWTIDPSDKKINEPQYLVRSSSYTSDTFWWGTRYYFRSNQAVDDMLHDLDNYSFISTGMGVLFSPALGALGAIYYQKVKSDLDYMNNIHRQEYLNMDVDWAGVYSIYVP